MLFLLVSAYHQYDLTLYFFFAYRAAWVPEIEYSVDYLAKQAIKAAKQAKDKLLALAAASKVSESTKVAAKLSTVEQIEQILLKQLSIRQFPPISSIHDSNAVGLFTGEVFWIQGYGVEVCISCVAMFV